MRALEVMPIATYFLVKGSKRSFENEVLRKDSYVHLEALSSGSCGETESVNFQVQKLDMWNV